MSRCYNCNSPFHKSTKCPNPPRAKSNGLKCYGCGGNHKRENCTSTNSTSHSSINQNLISQNSTPLNTSLSTLKCFACGLAGHKRDNCPREQKQVDQNVDQKQVNQNVDQKQESKNEQSTNDKNDCCVCADEVSNTLLEPCNHLCVCQSCSTRIMFCPICRSNIANKKVIFRT